MCGVIGVIGSYHEDKVPFWAAYEAYRGLLTLQHRGQDAAGVLSYDKDRRKFYGKKNLGLVSQALEQEDLEALQEIFKESFEFGLEHEIRGHCLCKGEENRASLPVGILKEGDTFYLTRDLDTAYKHHPACTLYEWETVLGASA